MVGLQVASTEFDCPKVTKFLWTFVVLNQQFSEIKTSSNYCARGFNLNGAFVSRPPFNVMCLRIAKSPETTVSVLRKRVTWLQKTYTGSVFLCPLCSILEYRCICSTNSLKILSICVIMPWQLIKPLHDALMRLFTLLLCILRAILFNKCIAKGLPRCCHSNCSLASHTLGTEPLTSPHGRNLLRSLWSTVLEDDIHRLEQMGCYLSLDWCGLDWTGLDSQKRQK